MRLRWWLLLTDARQAGRESGSPRKESWRITASRPRREQRQAVEEEEERRLD